MRRAIVSDIGGAQHMRPQFDGGKLVTTLDAGPFVAPNARVASCAASAAGDEVALVLTDGGLALLYPP